MSVESNYAEKIIALTLADAKFVAGVREAVPEDHILSKELRAMYKAVLSYYEESDGVIPTRTILLDILRGTANMEEDGWGNLFDQVWDAHVEGDDAHLSFYAQRLEDGWRAEVIKRNVLAAVEKLKERDVDGATAALYAEWPKSRNAYIKGSIVDDLAAVSDELDERAKSPKLWEGIPMGFPTLDEATGGHGRGEFIVIIGGTGVGKSLVLGQISINVAKRGQRVLLVTVENNKWSYMNRLYSNLSRVPYYKFKRHQLDKHDKNQWLETMGNLHPDFDLEVVEFPEGCSARDIHFYMRQQERQFDYLVVDQITNMLPNDVKDHKPMSWQWFGQISLDLKRLSSYIYNNRGIPVLSAAQAAGGTVGKKEFTTDDVAMGKIILHHAHAGLYITKDEDGMFNMGASKYRDAKVDPFPVFPDFRTWTLTENPDMGDRVPPAPAGPAPAKADDNDFGQRAV
jgi:hypothetical protein